MDLKRNIHLNKNTRNVGKLLIAFFLFCLCGTSCVQATGPGQVELQVRGEDRDQPIDDFNEENVLVDQYVGSYSPLENSEFIQGITRNQKMIYGVFAAFAASCFCVALYTCWPTGVASSHAQAVSAMPLQSTQSVPSTKVLPKVIPVPAPVPVPAPAPITTPSMIHRDHNLSFVGDGGGVEEVGVLFFKGLCKAGARLVSSLGHQAAQATVVEEPLHSAVSSVALAVATTTTTTTTTTKGMLSDLFETAKDALSKVVPPLFKLLNENRTATVIGSGLLFLWLSGCFSAEGEDIEGLNDSVDRWNRLCSSAAAADIRAAVDGVDGVGDVGALARAGVRAAVVADDDAVVDAVVADAAAAADIRAAVVNAVVHSVAGADDDAVRGAVDAVDAVGDVGALARAGVDAAGGDATDDAVDAVVAAAAAGVRAAVVNATVRVTAAAAAAAGDDYRKNWKAFSFCQYSILVRALAAALVAWVIAPNGVSLFEWMEIPLPGFNTAGWGLLCLLGIYFVQSASLTNTMEANMACRVLPYLRDDSSRHLARIKTFFSWMGANEGHIALFVVCLVINSALFIMGLSLFPLVKMAITSLWARKEAASAEEKEAEVAIPAEEKEAEVAIPAEEKQAVLQSEEKPTHEEEHEEKKEKHFFSILIGKLPLPLQKCIRKMLESVSEVLKSKK